MKQWRGSVMAKIIEFSVGARADFDESFDWYAERSESAAIGFADALEAAFNKILADPNWFSRTIRGCQYSNLKRYPFRVVFHQEETRILIVAIAHAKRRPYYWRNRV
jgi:plasmid stabilization system protein ParE